MNETNGAPSPSPRSGTEPPSCDDKKREVGDLAHEERCPDCGYTWRDVHELMDHNICGGPGPAEPDTYLPHEWESTDAITNPRCRRCGLTMLEIANQQRAGPLVCVPAEPTAAPSRKPCEHMENDMGQCELCGAWPGDDLEPPDTQGPAVQAPGAPLVRGTNTPPPRGAQEGGTSSPADPTPGLREALMAARDGLWRAFNMLSAINDSDPSADRMKAKMDAAEAMKAADRSLLASSPSTDTHKKG